MEYVCYHEMPWIIINILFWLFVNKPLHSFAVLVVIGLFVIGLFHTLRTIVYGLINLTKFLNKKLASYKSVGINQERDS